MDIIKKNTIATFEIVPRFLPDTECEVFLVNENTREKETLTCLTDKLPNENYFLTFTTFPKGKIGHKIAYTIIDEETNEITVMGKMMIVDENEDIQNYLKKTNTKFYN